MVRAPQVHSWSFGQLLLALAVLWLGLLLTAAGAAPLDSSKLRAGADVFETFRGHDPKVDAFLDKVVDRLPPDAKPDGSSMTALSPTTRDRDVERKNNVFLRDRDGNIKYGDKSRMRSGMSEFTRFIAEQPDFEALWNEAKSLVPAKHRSTVDALDKGLEAFEKTLGRSKTVRGVMGLFGAPTSRAEVLQNQGVSRIMKELDKVSNKNRKRAERELSRIRAAASPGTGTPGTGTGTPSGGSTPSGGTSTAGGTTPSGPSAACTKGDAALATAKSQVAAGQLGAAESTLGGIDTTGCPRLAGPVSQAQSDITSKVSALNAAATSAMSSCDPSTINTAAGDLGGVSHPGLTTSASQLTTRASALTSANTEFEQARTAYKGGNLGAARSGLNSVIGNMQSAGIQNCPPYTRATNGLGKIDRLENAIRTANAIAASCDPQRIDNAISKLSAVNHVLAQQAVQRLNSAKARCEQEQKNEQQNAAAAQNCIDRYGPTSYVISSTADGITQCGCREPTVFNFEGSRCVNKGDVMAEGDQSCRDEFGPHAYADYQGSSYKTYVCNCGGESRWNKGKTRCITREDILADIRRRANSACRKKCGRRLISVSVKSNGKYSCNCRKRTVRKKPPRKRQRASGGQRHQAAASVALGAAIGTGIGIGIRRGTRRGSSGGGRRRCHHRPNTSKTHCGGG